MTGRRDIKPEDLLELGAIAAAFENQTLRARGRRLVEVYGEERARKLIEDAVRQALLDNFDGRRLDRIDPRELGRVCHEALEGVLRRGAS